MPQTQHQLIVRDSDGYRIALVTDFLTLTYSKRVNADSVWSVLLGGDHDLAGTISDKDLVEVRRRVIDWGIDWYTDFYGVYRAPQVYNANDIDFFKAGGHSQLGVLNWRIVAYPAGEDGKSSFTGDQAEDIAKDIVNYNATANATTGNGRHRAGAITNFTITIEAGSGGGDTISSLGVTNKPLLDALSKCTGTKGGGDIDLIYTGSPGSPSWEFRWYEGQRGTDRSDSVRFMLNFGNMLNPTYTLDRMRERTVAIVGGKGEESDRDYVVRTGTNYAAANDIEVYVNASGIEKGNTTALNAAGDRKLDDLQARDRFDFVPVQTAGSAYGDDYCVGGDIGDLVYARYDSPAYGTIEGTFKITGVDVAIDNRGSSPIESIKLIIEEQ